MIKDVEPLLKECEETLAELMRMGNMEVACYVQGFINSINKLPDAEQRPHGEWIPCAERLPEKNGYYLVTTDGSHNDVIDIAEYGNFYRKPEHEYVLEWNKASKIIAWMPLPEPYKEEGEAEW